MILAIRFTLNKLFAAVLKAAAQKQREQTNVIAGAYADKLYEKSGTLHGKVIKAEGKSEDDKKLIDEQLKKDIEALELKASTSKLAIDESVRELRERANKVGFKAADVGYYPYE